MRVPRVVGLPDQGVFVWPMIADFGLANLAEEFGRNDGAKPYMAPEQWLGGRVTGAADVFALGVIICETLSMGFHPLGEVTSDWWPEPKQGRSKRWLRDDLWLRWVKAGNPLAEVEFLAPHVRDIIAACVTSDPADRPTLDALQQTLLDELRCVDPAAYEQADFQIVNAHMTTEMPADWTYRQQRLEQFIDDLEMQI